MDLRKQSRIVIFGFLLLFSQALWGQSSISGNVTNEEGEPLAGATIAELGTQNGVISNADGGFRLTLTTETPQIRISYLGYKAQTIKLDGRSELAITLEADPTTLEDVVVVGYGSVKKKDVTGAVSSITAEDFNQGIVLDPGQALQGKEAGITVIQANGADPSSAPKVRIRGSNSINLSSEPLYVVDGFPLPEGVGLDINPGDIKRMDILKDASATAIYGVRGANGVVLITTKEGSSQRTSLTYSGQFGMQRIIKPFEYASARALAEVDNNIAIDNGNIPPYSNAELDSIGDGTDWIDETFSEAFYHNHSLSLSSRSSKQSNYFSIGYTDREGVLANTDFERVNLTYTMRNTSVKNVKIFTSVKASAIDANFHNFNSGSNDRSSVMSLILYTNPLIPAYNPDGTYGDVPPTLNQARNPLPDVFDVVKQDRRFNVYTNFSAEYTFLKDFTYKLNLGFSFNNRRRGEFIPFTVQGGEPDAQGFGGRAEVLSSTRTNFLSEHLLTYEKEINENHKINILGGFTTQENDNETFITGSSGFSTESTTFYDLDGGNTPFIPVGNKVSWQIMSFLGRVNYTLADRYLLTASIRRDGASPFPVENRWGIFPSTAAGWKISEEPFLKEIIPAHTSIKLRAGWGITGNFRGISEGDSRSKLGPWWSTYTFDGTNDAVGLAPLNIPNPDLQWETTSQTNIGLDVSVLRGKWTFTADYYDKYTDNLIYERPVSRYTGFEEQIVTDGAVRNNGIELGLKGNINLAKDLSLKINGNFSYNRNRIDRLVGGADTLLTGGQIGFGGQTYPPNLLIVGQPISTFYGYISDRILQEDDPELLPDGLQPNSLPGDYLFKDLNGDGVIDENDRTILGHGLPTYVAGLNLKLSYKGLSMDAQFIGVFDVERFNFNRARGENIFWEAAEDRWTAVNTDTDIARANAWSNTQYGSFVNDIFVEDASYIRLQNITLSYDLSRIGIFDKMKNLTLSATAQNVFTLTNYQGFNPEASTGGSNAKLGIDSNAYPQSRNYLVSLTMKF